MIFTVAFIFFAVLVGFLFSIYFNYELLNAINLIIGSIVFPLTTSIIFSDKIDNVIKKHAILNNTIYIFLFLITIYYIIVYTIGTIIK